MGEYISSELMKFKHTFSKKLIIIVPIVTALLAFLMGGFYWYQVLTIYWWYAFLMPGTITLFCALAHQKEERAVKYYSIFSMPINLKRFWRAKELVVVMFLAAVELLLFLIVNVGKIIAPSLAQFTILQVLIGAIIIALTSLWQVPVSLFLVKKLNLVIALVLNGILGIFLPILVPTHMWWICPYSWTHHSIEAVLGIQSNGVLDTSRISNNFYEVLAAIVLSIALFVIISILSESWFEKQEAK